MAAFRELSRKHGFKISTTFPCSVEDCSLGVADVVGHSSIKSAARMNGGVVIFVDSVAKAYQVVESGIVVNDLFVSVSPLTTPAARITISNIPPFIGDEVLVRELSRHGKIVSPIRKLPSGCKSPLLRHVVSHRRQVHMILNKKDSELSLVFQLRVDDFDYAVFVNSGTLKCFGCGKEGHLVRACPEIAPKNRPKPAEAKAGPSKYVDAVKQRAASIEITEENVVTAKQCGENPEMAFLLCVDNGKNECGVQEKGNNVTEPAESVEAGPSSAAVEQSDSEGGLMEEEDSRCKAPLLKRKQTSETCGSKAKKTADREEKEVQTESSGEETESSEEEMVDCVTDSQPLTDSPLASASQLDGMYSVHSIQVFLKKTSKNKQYNYEECPV